MHFIFFCTLTFAIQFLQICTCTLLNKLFKNSINQLQKHILKIMYLLEKYWVLEKKRLTRKIL